MKATKLKDLGKGEFFTLRPHELKEDEEMPSRLVWVKDCYCRENKKYEAYKFDDICHNNYFSGDRIVYADFIF